MYTKKYLMSLSNVDDSRLSCEQVKAKKSIIARGLPYYGYLKDVFRDHFKSFIGCHNRARDFGYEIEFTRDVNGLIEFIQCVGDGPSESMAFRLDRKDRTKGYLKDNIKWEPSRK